MTRAITHFAFLCQELRVSLGEVCSVQRRPWRTLSMQLVAHSTPALKQVMSLGGVGVFNIEEYCNTTIALKSGY